MAEYDSLNVRAKCPQPPMTAAVIANRIVTWLGESVCQYLRH